MAVQSPFGSNTFLTYSRDYFAEQQRKSLEKKRNDAIAASRAKTAARDARLQKDLARFDAASAERRNNLMGVFAERANVAGATQTRGALIGAAQYANRHGLEGGIAASLAAGTQGRIAANVANATAGFNAELLNYENQNRQRLIIGELDYFHELDRMNYDNELSKNFAKFQADLARDQASRDAFINAVGAIGGVVLGGVL